MNGIDLLRDLAMVLAVSAVVTVLFQYLRQPVILGYILTGILIGPNTPPFSLIRNEEAIRTLAELGVILLMFTIGIHFSFRKLQQVGSSAVVGSLTELTGIFILGNLVGRWLGWSATESLFLGVILGMTSTTIMAKSLDSRGMLYHGFTKLAFGITLMEDIVAVGVLGILNSLGTTGHLGLADTGIKILQLIAFFGAIAVVGLLVVPRVIDWVTRVQSDETLLITVLGLVFLASWAAQAMGFSVALGAFLMGAVLAEVRQVKRVERLVAPVKDVFSALFFTASGMLIQLDFSGSGIVPVLAIVGTLIFGKVFFCTLGSLLGGAPLRPAVQAGMSLVAIGEFSFVLAAMGINLGMTDAKLYSTIVLVSAVSTLASPYLIGTSEPFSRWLAKYGPRWFLQFWETYGSWLKRLKAAPSDRHKMARAFARKLIGQMALQLILVTAAIFGAGGSWAILRDRVPAVLRESGWGGPLFWLGGALVALPVAVALVRKFHAFCLLTSEMAFPRPESPEKDVGPARKLTVLFLGGLGVLLFSLYLAVISWPLIPGVGLLVALLMIVGLVAAAQWKTLTVVYASGQAQIRETWETAPDEELPRLPGNAAVRVFRVGGESTLAGRSVAETQLRQKSGVVVVAIERRGGNVVSPGPGETLAVGDEIFLFGDQEQLKLAEEFLGQNGVTAI